RGRASPERPPRHRRPGQARRPRGRRRRPDPRHYGLAAGPAGHEGWRRRAGPGMTGSPTGCTRDSLGRSLSVVGRALAEPVTPQAAKALAELRAGPDVQARIDELAEKCNEGRLSPAEQAEYRGIVEAIDFISLLQAKARDRLARAAP